MGEDEVKTEVSIEEDKATIKRTNINLEKGNKKVGERVQIDIYPKASIKAWVETINDEIDQISKAKVEIQKRIDAVKGMDIRKKSKIKEFLNLQVAAGEFQRAEKDKQAMKNAEDALAGLTKELQQLKEAVPEEWLA